MKKKSKPYKKYKEETPKVFSKKYRIEKDIESLYDDEIRQIKRERKW